MIPRPLALGALALTVLTAGAGAQATPAPAKPDTSAHAAAAPAPMVDSAKALAIHQLLDAMGVRKTMDAMVVSMMASFRSRMPNVPEEFWTEMEKEFAGSSLLDLMIPIYDKHYSLDEIRAMTAFFETPVGRKFVAEQPAMVQEGMAVGQAWGREVGMRIMKKLKEKGYSTSS